MEVLKLSPDELFKLIESSQGYTGEDYSRWLTGKIIEVAEADGVQFSQLLVKKFNIINEIIEEVSDERVIRDEYLDIFTSHLSKNLYSVDFDGIGKPLDVDWFNGLDLDSENSFFVKEKLPEELRDAFLENEKVSILLKVSLDAPDKKSELYSEAKGQLLNLQSKGAMMIYRLCSMVRAFGLLNASFGLLLPVKFLWDTENEGIITYMLDHFKIDTGFSMKSVEVSTNSFNAGDLAYIVLKPKVEGDEEEDGVVLTSITLDEGKDAGYKEVARKRYSKSHKAMLGKIISETSSDITGKILGYLHVNGKVSLSSAPEVGKKNIPIVEENIKDIIAYYGVTVSREAEWGYTSDIPCLIDGRDGYEELLYNCLPLFLFDYNADFSNKKGVTSPDGEVLDYDNKLDVLTSPEVQALYDVGSPYFSFEAKELYNICKEYLEYTKDNIGVTGKSFKELREESDNSDFNNMYEYKLLNLRAYVNTLSKKYL